MPVVPEQASLPADYFLLLRRGWRIVILGALCGVAIGVVAVVVTHKQYSAKTQLYVSVQTGQTAADLYQDSSVAQSQMQSYAAVVETPAILGSAAAAIHFPGGASALGRHITTSITTGSVILGISATALNPRTAASIANAVGTTFARVIPQLQVAGAGGSPVKVTTIQSAVPLNTPSSPKKTLDVALGLVLGLVAGCLAAVLSGVIDPRIKRTEDLGALTDAPVLASVPDQRQGLRRPVAFDEPEQRERAEAYRLLRTALHFVNAARSDCVTLVTSAAPGEGKTLTALNLAVALADGGRKVVIVDADLRRPSVARYAGLADGAGLTRVLVGDLTVDDALQYRPTHHGNPVAVLTSGPIPPNPSELLASERFDAVLEDLREHFEDIIIDSPPLTLVADASVLAGKASGVVMVVGSRRVRKQDVRRAFAQLQTMDANVLGLVLNRVKRSKRTGYAGYYGIDAAERDQKSVVAAQRRLTGSVSGEALRGEAPRVRTRRDLRARKAP